MKDFDEASFCLISLMLFCDLMISKSFYVRLILKSDNMLDGMKHSAHRSAIVMSLQTNGVFPSLDSCCLIFSSCGF